MLREFSIAALSFFPGSSSIPHLGATA